jgi:hypothetical protein
VAIPSSSGKGTALAEEPGGLGSNLEVIDLVTFLASGRSTTITGRNIRHDGGITRSV